MCDIAQTLNLKKQSFNEYPPEGKHLQILSERKVICATFEQVKKDH